MRTKKNLPENTSNSQVPSDLTLEKFIIGELDPEEAAHISRILNGSYELKTRLENMKKSSQDILKKYPTELISKYIRSKINQRRSRKVNIARAIWTFASVAVAVMLVFTLTPDLHRNFNFLEKYSEERTKGIVTGLQIYRKSGDSLERLANGEFVKPHDLIQISYSVERRKFGVIISVDGRKQVTLHWPEKPGPAPSLEPGREVVLPSSFELDESPLYETFILLTSEQPFESEQVLLNARSSRMDPKTDQFEINLPAGIQQVAIILRKQQ